MITANPQAINYPYPTANTPPLTTHHALIVCGALFCVCPCDDDRDANKDDCDPDVSPSDQFSWKLLWNATILVLRRQKPLTNALDWLYLQCVDYMLEACWVESCDVSLPRCTCDSWKSCQWLPFTYNGRGGIERQIRGAWPPLSSLFHNCPVLQLPIYLAWQDKWDPCPLPSNMLVACQ